jgi:ketol-acid reductoisomerase
MAKPIRTIHIFGLGSQAQAWVRALTRHDWKIFLYLRHPSKAVELLGVLPTSVTVHLTNESTQLVQAHPGPLALLLTDRAIPEIYENHLRQIDLPLHLVLAHGIAMTAGWLKPLERHFVSLLAPKAIGQELDENHARAFPAPHGLKAAFAPAPSLPRFHPFSPRTELLDLASDLGFTDSTLIPCTLDQETYGDLISEQGLLCGGLWSLLKWTLLSMKKAGIPDALIQEECFRELELIASILKKHGPAGTFERISSTALEGALQMQESLEASNAKTYFEKQIAKITSGEFFDSLEGSQEARARQLAKVSETWSAEALTLLKQE